MQAESTINLREITFVRLLLPMLAGILLALQISISLWYVASFGLLCFVGMIGLQWLKKYEYRWAFGVALIGWMMSLGYLLCTMHNDLNQAQHFSSMLDNNTTIMGQVTTLPKRGKRLKTTLSVLAVSDSTGQLNTATGNLLAHLEPADSATTLAYGDVVILKGWIQPIAPPMNPYQFDYQRYLKFQNIHYQAFIKKENWRNTGVHRGNIVLKTAQKIRIACINRLRTHLNTEREFSVGAALILGYKDEISQDVRNAYSQTGAMHVLAVSGLHVGLIYLFLNFFLGFVKTRNRIFKIIKPILLILGIWLFALLTGMSPSVMRAATMFSFIVVGMSMRRFTNIYNTLACSAFFLLCFNPYLIMNVGFQLSYLAVLGIVYFQPRIYLLLDIYHPFVDNLWALMAVSIAAQFATLPLSWYYFHQFPVFFWLASLIVVPAATFILALGILTLILSVVPFVGFLVGKLLFGLIWVVNALIFGIQKLPLGLIEGIWVGSLTVLILYGVLLAVAWFLKTRHPAWFLTALSLLFVVVSGRAYSMMKQISQQKITVYHNYKNAIADFISSEKSTTLTNIGTPTKQANFANSNHQNALGIAVNDKAHFKGNHQNSFLFLQQDFIQFYDKKIVVIGDNNLLNSSVSMDMDYAIIQNNPYLKMNDIKHKFNPEMIIFDPTNSPKAIEVWKKQCAEIGLVYHNVNEQGAWEIAFH